MTKRCNFLVALILLCPVVLILSGCSSKKVSKESVTAQYLKTVHNSHYMMHALGGVDGTYSYVNSIDALKLAYDEGCRLFEADVSFTSDQKLVLAHGSNDVWTESDWEERLGQPYDLEHPTASFDEFMSFQIQGRFRATSFEDIVAFMAEHDDVFLMVDVGRRDYEETGRIYQAIVDTVGTERESVLWHFIVGGHSTEAMKAVQEVYPFPIQNLYFAPDRLREEIIYTPKVFLDYCKEHDILSFSVSSKNYTAELDDPDVISYIFTVDEEEEAQALFDAGADIIGTNFLRD